ncbi:hypothetical protein [Actinoallomurus iriomotensis]|uniref:Uncharacterized protein n=1 Tax=Actinoallomurus iriomotensis TaxID=478107 RepID=A0A9W6SET9_9ACTN|nr:hypothetical protein [Actinoallomurus iriomotensis]GLY92148.1 hypothetical protein Airi02_100760 [Actinoallomurus iriomotensis]
MNREEMREALRRDGVPDELYELGALDGGSRTGDGWDFLEERDHAWVVGRVERGRREVLERFDTEDEACRFFHDRLVRMWTPRVPAPETPEEEERGRRITEEAVRRFKDSMKAREE